VAVFQRDPKTRSCVSCPTCSHEIPLASTLRLPGVFSVPCPNCGQRKVYQSAEAHDPKQEAEVVKASGPIQFATRRKRSMRPKSWLHAWVSSL
jgi:endogenous inhibitor of DNA gyrase (YacG/DUF329 family)